MKNKLEAPSTDTDHIFLLFGPSWDPQAGFLVPLRTIFTFIWIFVVKTLGFQGTYVKE